MSRPAKRARRRRPASSAVDRSLRAWLDRCPYARAGAHWLVGVSGGGDSVALLRLLAQEAGFRGMRLTVAHLHHGLRGRAADADARWVHDLAGRLGCPVVIEWADTPARARANKESLEMAARELRRAFLAEAARDIGADAIVLGHTADDQAETLLLNLVRGCGPDGLAGMSPEDRLRGIPLLRPLLDVRRQDLRRYLRARRQPWREDATNRSGAALRNRVRMRVLPVLERALNPQAVPALARAAARLRDDRDWWRAAADRAWPRVARESPGHFVLNIRAWRRLPGPLQGRLLQRFLRAAGVPAAQVTQRVILRAQAHILDRDATAGLALPGGRQARRRAGPPPEWDVGPAVPAAAAPGTKRVRLNTPGRTELPAWGLVAVVERSRGFKAVREAGLDRWPASASIAAGGSKRPIRLTVRGARPGDAYRAFRAPGRRKLQDIFTDERLPRAQRAGYPVVVCGREMVWLPGYRPAHDWRVPSPAAPAWKIRLARLDGELP